MMTLVVTILCEHQGHDVCDLRASRPQPHGACSILIFLGAERSVFHGTCFSAALAGSKVFFPSRGPVTPFVVQVKLSACLSISLSPSLLHFPPSYGAHIGYLHLISLAYER